MPINGSLQQIELVPGRSSIKPNLGPDITLCNSSNYFIDSNIDPSIYSLLWSNGATDKGISVTSSGWYWLEVKECTAIRDSIFVLFSSPPPSFTFGPDQSQCKFESRQLKPFENPTGFVFHWQDGSTKSTYEVNDYGTYWVEVKNFCGSVTDTLRLVKPVLDISKVPNVITPNGDSKNDHFTVQDNLKGELSFQVFNRWGDPVFQSSNYNNDWDGGDLASGVYYFQLNGSCIQKFKSPITIIR